jgi:hypothetical protein
VHPEDVALAKCLHERGGGEAGGRQLADRGDAPWKVALALAVDQEVVDRLRLGGPQAVLRKHALPETAPRRRVRAPFHLRDLLLGQAVELEVASGVVEFLLLPGERIAKLDICLQGDRPVLEEGLDAFQLLLGDRNLGRGGAEARRDLVHGLVERLQDVGGEIRLGPRNGIARHHQHRVAGLHDLTDLDLHVGHQPAQRSGHRALVQGTVDDDRLDPSGADEVRATRGLHLDAQAPQRHLGERASSRLGRRFSFGGSLDRGSLGGARQEMARREPEPGQQQPGQNGQQVLHRITSARSSSIGSPS